MFFNDIKKNSDVLRWLALFSLIINIFFNYYLNANPVKGQTVGDISDKYPTLFTPAGYAFAIWGVIYFSLIVYVVFQLLPSQKKFDIYDQLSIPFILINFLSILWLYLFINEKILLSTIVIILMLICSIILFGKANMWTRQKKGIGWLSIPFGLYMGWLSVATIANFSILFTSVGWRGEALGESTWTILILTVALFLGLLVSFKFTVIIYPIVLSWAFVAIYVARDNEEQAVATIALINAIVLIV